MARQPNQSPEPRLQNPQKGPEKSSIKNSKGPDGGMPRNPGYTSATKELLVADNRQSEERKGRERQRS